MSTNLGTKLLILGATSAIAYETAKCFASTGANLFLVARNADRLETLAQDLKARGAARVETRVLDLADLSSHQELMEQVLYTLGGLDMLLVAYGTLGDQRQCELSVEETLKELNNNAISIISLLTIAANYFEKRRQGCIAVISSVAGDRGRKSNYVYGTAKGALSIFLQGLRNRLSSYGVTVLTIKPGPVSTPMTEGRKKGLLSAKPGPVGEAIYQAMLKKKDIVYLPWFWNPIMLVVRSIPESLFKRLSLP